MQLFLITNEFFKSAMSTSFRATVIAPDANAARWLVGQRSRGFEFEEVAAATVFSLGDITQPTEGVLTVERRSGSKLFSTSEFYRYEFKEDNFYEVTVNPEILKDLPGIYVPGKHTWFALKSNTEILMRRVECEQTPALAIGQGYYSKTFVVQQFFRVGKTSEQTWTYKAAGEQYKTQYYDMSRASLLQMRALILSSARCLPYDNVAGPLLAKLWSVVQEEQIGNAAEVGAQFYEGQKLYWAPDDIRDWAMALPQVIAGTPTIDESLTVPVAGTKCVTLKPD